MINLFLCYPHCDHWQALYDFSGARLVRVLMDHAKSSTVMSFEDNSFAPKYASYSFIITRGRRI